MLLQCHATETLEIAGLTFAATSAKTARVPGRPGKRKSVSKGIAQGIPAKAGLGKRPSGLILPAGKDSEPFGAQMEARRNAPGCQARKAQAKPFFRHAT
jgi:hypothetical protein